MIIKKLTEYVKNGGLFWIQRSSHEKHTTPPEHGHEFIEMVYVVHGEGVHRIGDDLYPIHAGDLYFIHIGEPHEYRLEEGSGLEIINCMFLPEFVRAAAFDQALLAGLPYLSPIFNGGDRFISLLSLNSKESSAILTLLEHLLHEMKHTPAGYMAMARYKLTEILILLSRYSEQRTKTEPAVAVKPGGGNEIVVRKIKTYLERHFRHKITVSTLSQQFNLSERHIIRIFKQETGQSITEMLHQIRIERAKHLLLETNRSIEAVALAVGFADTSFFSRLFARKEGCTPGTYRRRVQQL